MGSCLLCPAGPPLCSTHWLTSLQFWHSAVCVVEDNRAWLWSPTVANLQPPSCPPSTGSSCLAVQTKVRSPFGNYLVLFLPSLREAKLFSFHHVQDLPWLQGKKDLPLSHETRFALVADFFPPSENSQEICFRLLSSASLYKIFGHSSCLGLERWVAGETINWMGPPEHLWHKTCDKIHMKTKWKADTKTC